MEESISLNKFISDTGYCSRREADNLIKAGRVLLNNNLAELGNRYSPGDVVEVDGSLITPDNKEKRVYLALNKPVGITSTTELQVKGNIISFVNYPKRIFPIGRLDKDSEGLIFLTNDGDIINKILRAGNSHEKEYIVRVNKTVDPHFAQKMSGGLPIMGTRTLPCKVQLINRHTFRIILTQGLNRQIRRMCEFLGYSVESLQRVRIMDIKLGNLALGKWRHLSDVEVEILKQAVADSSGAAKAVRPEKKNTGYIPGGKKGMSPEKAADPKKKTQNEEAEDEDFDYESFLKENPQKGKSNKGKSAAWWNSRQGKAGKDNPANKDNKQGPRSGKAKFDDKRSGSSKDGSAKNKMPGGTKKQGDFNPKKSGPSRDNTGAQGKKTGAGKSGYTFKNSRPGAGKDQSRSSGKKSGNRQQGNSSKNKGRSGR
ncbi:MAG: 23S rRNA pseudouridine(2604) synthase RluF [Pseudobacter sp.]|uniref:23S rRNA pseudouridine(2604) synthase RluF n=1 Tax=Pseudobacter sp. TaxID=2045420 RepID=UPI003F8086A7